ncbi:MAG: alpha-L-fucosidase [Clostridiales bacterium]|jgi:alpha-L-fucosidase|nr:alpha-L-fucosidase [Clostridiales bacterium]
MAELDLENEGEAAQGVHGYLSESEYVPPTEPTVIESLENWRDKKLALMMHWGPYSQLGLVESWALSDADAEWSRQGVDWEADGETFKRQYADLNKTFNPIRFQPVKWAQEAKDAGFKYLIFTTKHHDGFCMWDSAYTDYKVTGPDCPFNAHKYADVCAHLFEAFRRQGLGIAAYFSKADWNTPLYWAKDTRRGRFMWRGPSYDPADGPGLWEEFVQFTHNQVMELVTNYGRLDVLWFDAGWVCRRNGQDIRIEELVAEARRVQPWLIAADRTCGGPCENYITPEQCVPGKALNVPWESCVTMGTSFSYKYDDDYKSVRQLIHLLIDIAAKGGNLALNVGPQPDGRLPENALRRMRGMGKWLARYGGAIYGTRACAPFRMGDFAFTQKAAERKVYAFCLYKAAEDWRESVIIPYTGKVARARDLASGAELPFERVNGGIRVQDGTPSADAELYDGCAHIAGVFELTLE